MNMKRFAKEWLYFLSLFFVRILVLPATQFHEVARSVSNPVRIASRFSSRRLAQTAIMNCRVLG